MEQIIDKLGLSARAYSRMIKVARTIADLEEAPDILPAFLREAAGYRFLDKVAGTFRFPRRGFRIRQDAGWKRGGFCWQDLFNVFRPFDDAGHRCRCSRKIRCRGGNL